jgi:rhamnosyltransferase subunit B
MPRHIVITVFGSLGDLHPMMALGIELQARGHRVTLAASQVYREKILSENLGFMPLGPEFIAYERAVYDELFDRFRGPELLVRKYLLPYVKQTADSLRPLLENADFLLNSPTVYAGPVLAEVLKLPWASVALQPFGYFSAYDPPVLPQLPITEQWYHFPPVFWKVFWGLLKGVSGFWPQSVYDLRREYGLPSRGNPIFEGQCSPYLNLALFSPLVAACQPDWPKHTQTTGFVFYDRMKEDETTLPEPVRAFLASGEPPVVFTLGSSVVQTSTDFFETSIKAVKALGCRAIFVAGEHQPQSALTERMLWWDALPYSQLFPHASVIVHQGGMGTTAQAMRAGKPMLIVPHGFDQPDNAARLKRLGVSQTIHPEHYRESTAVQALETLLHDLAYREKADAVGQTIQQENGLVKACDAIEQVLNKADIHLNFAQDCK